MAKNDFEWLVCNILVHYRDTKMDVRSSSEYRQLIEDMQVESLAATNMLTDTSHVIDNFDAELYKRVQERDNNTHRCTFVPTSSSITT